MPQVANLVDTVVWKLWDHVTTAAAANTLAQYTFFNVPIGTAGKTKVNTNMEQVMRLPDPEWMNILAIGFYFGPNMALVDLHAFVNTYYYEFKVGDKVYDEGILPLAPAGAGLSVMTTRTSECAIANGNPQKDNVVDLRLPAPLGDGLTGIVIGQGEKFKVEVTGTPFALAAAAGVTFGTGLNLWCVLYGIKSRGVR